MSKSRDTDELRSLLRRVREIEIRSNRKAESVLSGEYRTVFKGSGIEFEEVREYQRGDDIRAIDWNVTARTGKVFVKKYSEERELQVYLLADVSGSQFFGSGSQTKEDVMTEIAAVLFLSAVKSKDKVGLLQFSDRVEKFVPAKKGKSHVLRLIREMLTVQPEGKGTNITLALSRINQLLKHRAIIFVLSDFYHVPEKKVLQITASKHDLVPIVLRDPLESSVPAGGTVFFEDPESGRVIPVNTSSSRVQRRIAKYAAARDAHLQHLFRSINMDSLFVQAGSDYVHLLMNFFKRRASRF